MKNIRIPETVEEYREDVVERAFPEPLIAEHPFYKNLINWVIDNRTPLLYEQDHDDEYANLSINFNWLLLRDYSETQLGRPTTIAAMYALHEFTHMTHWLPIRLDEISDCEYAEQFTRSEYRASNETEILIHYRIPELRKFVFQGMTIAYDLLKERQPDMPSVVSLANLRPVLVEGSELDDWLGDSDEAEGLIERFKSFGGNRQWARERFNLVQNFFTDHRIPLGDGICTHDFEEIIANYETGLTQSEYVRNVCRNVRLGFAMCGEEIPFVFDLETAIEKAKELEGRHAITQS